MIPDAAGRAAALLLEARGARRPLAALPDDCRPATLEEGYRIQDAFVAQAGGRLAGFKIGATSPRAQNFLEVDEPFAGCVLEGALLDSPAEIPAGDFIFRLVETEFAVRLGADLPAARAPYNRDAVRAAVASVHPAFEIVTCALGDWARQGAPSLVADNGVHGALVLGPACTEWRAFDLPGHAVTLTVNGEPAGTGTGANTLGDPMLALAWLANQRAGRGLGLEAGQVITTGVVTEFLELDAGDTALGDFGPIGQVRLAFTA